MNLYHPLLFIEHQSVSTTSGPHMVIVVNNIIHVHTLTDIDSNI